MQQTISLSRDDIDEIHHKIPPGTTGDVLLVIDEVVHLTVGDYKKLIVKYSVEFVNQKISDISVYEHNRKAKYKDYYRTLDNWCKKDYVSTKKVF